MNAKNLSLGLASLALLALASVTAAEDILPDDREEEAECIADANGDGYVGFNDLTEVVTSWGVCEADRSEDGTELVFLPCPADFTRDNEVNFHDLTILLINYGHSCLTDAIQP